MLNWNLKIRASFNFWRILREQFGTILVEMVQNYGSIKEMQCKLRQNKDKFGAILEQT